MTSQTFAVMVVLAAFSAAPGPVLAKGKPAEEGCKQKIEVPGFPHTLKSVAEINAVRNWTDAVMQHGDDYAQWHFARRTSVECKAIGKEGLIQCHAAGTPCIAKIKPSANVESAAGAN